VAMPYVADIARHHYQILGWFQLSGQFLSLSTFGGIE